MQERIRLPLYRRKSALLVYALTGVLAVLAFA